MKNSATKKDSIDGTAPARSTETVLCLSNFTVALKNEKGSNHNPPLFSVDDVATVCLQVEAVHVTSRWKSDNWCCCRMVAIV